MQKLFDHQVTTAASDRSLLLGNSEWSSDRRERTAEVHDPSQESVSQIVSDQRRMLGGNFIIEKK